MFDFDHTKDFYKILWVSETASDDEIKKAFRKSAMKHHPDKWGDAEEFKKINEAYQVIGDNQKRSQYDNVRKWWYWWFGGGGWFWWGWFDFGNWGGFQVDMDWFGDLWDIIDQLMTGWMWRNRPKRGQDIQISVKISFEEGYHWVKKTIKYNKTIYNEQSRTQETKEVEGNIPAGIENWQYIKYTGMWDGWRNWGPDWDLYVQIVISSHPKYSRKWDDIYQSIEVSIFDIVLGWKVTISHPDGDTEVKIPAWTQVSDIVRVRWKWFKKWWIFWNNWDMMLTIKLSTPKKLSKEQEKLRWELNKISK